MAESAESAWRAAVGKVLQGGSPEALTARSRDGIRIEPLYPPAAADASGPWRAVDRPFRIIQRIEHPDPSEANRLARTDAENGAAGLTLSLAGARGARGFGLAGDLAAALEDIELEGLALRLERSPFTGAADIERLAQIIGAKGLSPELVVLDVGIDPVGDLARTGYAPAMATDGPDANARLFASVSTEAEACRNAGFASLILRADGLLHHEAGASDAQELAAVLSTAVTYLRALEGLGLDTAREAISFTLAADADQLLTVAKLRALRRLWTEVETACGLDPRPIRLHAETAWRMQARQDPWSNLLRSAVASASAILGGADSLTVLPFTAALGLPDAFARRLARNTALVLLEEANLGRVADPAAGSGLFGAVTTALSEEAWRIFQSLERAGGLAQALMTGIWQRDVAAMRDQRRAEFAAGTRPIVGVTAYAHAVDLPPVLRPWRADDEADPRAPYTPLPVWRDAEDHETASRESEEVTP